MITRWRPEVKRQHSRNSRNSRIPTGFLRGALDIGLG